MVDKVLIFLERQMDNFLRRRSNTTNSIIKIAGLNASLDDLDDCKLQLAIVNIEEELALSNRVNYVANDNYISKKKTPVYLNVYIIVSVVLADKAYKENLKWLSLAIQFFQRNTTFLASEVSMPSGVEKLNFESVNLSIDNMSRFWSAIGEKYRPSMIYKIRMIKIDDDSVDSVIPVLKQPKTNVQK